MKIHHLGIVVSSIEKSVHILSKMGYQQTGSITKDTIQNNRIVFMCHSGALTVELIEPLNESSTVYNAGLGYHHIFLITF